MLIKSPMKWFIKFFVILTTLTSAGCSDEKTPQSTLITPSAAPIAYPTTAPTTTPITLEQAIAAIEGEWQVQTSDLLSSSASMQQLGTLTIEGGSYLFQPATTTLTQADIPPTIQFLFSALKGEVILEYLPDKQNRFLADVTFKSETVQVGRLFIGIRESHLYFHSSFSEIQVWNINKEIAP